MRSGQENNQIDLTFQKCLFQIGRILLAGAYLDAGIPLHKFGQDGGQSICRPLAGASDDDLSAGAVGDVFQLSVQIIVEFQHFLCGGVILLSCKGQAQWAAGAVQQKRACFFLYRRNATAERRLRNIKLLRRLGYAPTFCHGDKITHLV